MRRTVEAFSGERTSASVQRVTIYAADKHPLYLEAICRTLSLDVDLELLGFGRSGNQARDDVTRLRPAVAVLDIDDTDVEQASAVDIVALAGGHAYPTRVLCLTSSIDGGTVRSCLGGGVAGYLSKEAGGREIHDAILAIAGGQTVLDPALQDALVGALFDPISLCPLAVLTPRELDVLRLTADGLTAVAAGEELGINWTTIRTHLHTSFGKLGVSSQAAAVACALRRGLIS